MTSIIDVFAPYLPTIVFILSIFINIVVIIMMLRSQGGFNILGLVVLNVVLMLITNSLALAFPELNGLIQYDIISAIYQLIVGLVSSGLDDLITWIF